MEIRISVESLDGRQEKIELDSVRKEDTRKKRFGFRSKRVP